MKHSVVMEFDLKNSIEFLLKTHVTSIDKVESGGINDVFEIKINDGTRPSNCIYKGMRRKPLDQWEKGRFVREGHILDKLDHYSVPVPSSLHTSGHDIQETYFGSILMTKIDGMTLQKKWPELAEQSKSQIATRLAEQLKKIHSIPVDQLTFMMQPPVPLQWYWMNFLQESIDHALETNKVTNYLQQSTLDKVKTCVQASFVLLNDSSLSLVHGDFCSDNIIVNQDDEVCGWIDWEWALLADPLYELTDIKNDVFLGDEKATSQFYQTYGLDLQNEEMKKKLALYKIIQEVRGVSVGYLYHNPDTDAFKRIENEISNLLTSHFN